MQNTYRHINDCLEANRYYLIISERHRAMSKGVRVCTSMIRANDVIAEAYLGRASHLTENLPH